MNMQSKPNVILIDTAYTGTSSIDTDASTRESMKLALEREGIAVQVEETAASFLQKLKGMASQKKYAVIFQMDPSAQNNRAYQGALSIRGLLPKAKIIGVFITFDGLDERINPPVGLFDHVFLRTTTSFLGTVSEIRNILDSIRASGHARASARNILQAKRPRVKHKASQIPTLVLT